MESNEQAKSGHASAAKEAEVGGGSVSAAGRGEGLARLAAKWRNLAESAKYYKEEARRLRMELAAEKHAMTEYDLTKCAKDLETALEAAACLPSVGQAPPSMPDELPLVVALAKIRDCDDACQCECGKDPDCCNKLDVFCGHCIANQALLDAALATPSPQAPQCCCNASWLDLDRRDCPVHGPAATQEQPAGSAGWTPSAKDHMDLKEKFNAHIPATDRNHKGPATLDRISGSPRKVGEDGAKIGDEVTWTGQEGKRCRERIRRITEPQPGNYVFWVGKDEFPVNHQQVELVPRPSGLSLSSLPDSSQAGPIEPTPSANSEVSRYFWDKAARWLDGQKMPPDLQRTMELAKLLEEVAADGATSQSFK